MFLANRSSKSGYLGITALIAVIIFVILSTTVFFKITTVTVKGSSIYTAEEICAASGIKSGNNLIRTNMGKAAEKIENSLIYIETAELKRSFPSGVEITVKPCREAVSAEYEEGFCLLSESGKVLKTAEEPFPDTIVIYGARTAPIKEEWEETDETAATSSNVTSATQKDEAAAEEENGETTPIPTIGSHFECTKDNRTEIFYRLVDISNSAFQGMANSFDMTDHHNISCVYDGRITVEFGAVTELDYKIKLASSILKDKIGKKTEGTLRMLSGGASFIDKAGIEQNEINYQNNLAAQTAAETEESDAGESASEETSSGVVHFE